MSESGYNFQATLVPSTSNKMMHALVMNEFIVSKFVFTVADNREVVSSFDRLALAELMK